MESRRVGWSDHIVHMYGEIGLNIPEIEERRKLKDIAGLDKKVCTFKHSNISKSEKLFVNRKHTSGNIQFNEK